LRDRLFFAVFFQLACAAVISCAPRPPVGEKPLSGLKIICVWTIQADNQEAVEQAVAQAKSLGFNALCWDRPAVVSACHRRGMKAFALICPLDRREGARLQVLRPGEEKLPGFESDNIPPGQFYQYGGEPVPGKREILDRNFACPNDSGVLGYTLKQVARVREQGYDGIIWDFVGYRNYRSCECEPCRELLERFSRKHPEMSAKEAGERFYGKVLVDLYSALYRETKAMAPELIIANHIHPVFLPDIFYGQRVKVDYSGITVSWFFKPHWSLNKVREYTHRVVRGPYLHREVEGMPMIGVYTDGKYAGDRKSARRLGQEFEILKEVGARHLIICELGNILRDREASRIVEAELTDN